MIVLLGASGYVGRAFEQDLQRRGAKFISLARQQVDYARFDVLLKFLHDSKPEFLLNAAGYTGKPNVDACETARADTLQGNTLLPVTIAQACAATNTPWGHVSSGCIYTGAHLVENARRRVENDLTRPELRALVEKNPSAVTMRPRSRVFCSSSSIIRALCSRLAWPRASRCAASASLWALSRSACRVCARRISGAA